MTDLVTDSLTPSAFKNRLHQNVALEKQKGKKATTKKKKALKALSVVDLLPSPFYMSTAATITQCVIGFCHWLS